MIRRLFPILSWLPNYKKAYLSGDISAGLTVGIVLIPQGMAYAMIAGLPPVYGLYAALMPQFVYALMGTSPHLSVGPVAMDSLLVAAGLGTLSLSGIDEYIAMAIVLAFFVGCIQLALGILKMGFLVNFLSTPVISGLTSAVALIIGLNQLNHLLGIDFDRSSKLHELISNLYPAIKNIPFYACFIGLTSILLLIGLRYLNKKIPAALVVVVIGILGVYFFDLHAKGVAIVADIPHGLPSLSIPSIASEKLRALFPIALTLALIAFMEAMSLAKAMESKHSYEVRPNQELVALGFANIIGSLFKSYPTTGSFSRTAIYDDSGAKTGLAGLISTVVIGVTLLFFTSLFYHLPNATLAAIILVSVIGLINVTYPKQLFKTRKDEFLLLMVTFLLTLFVGIMEGILFGTLFALLLMVYRTSKPHMAELGKIKGTSYFKNVKRFEDEVEVEPSILVVRFDAQLYFGNKDYFKSEILRLVASRKANLSTLIIKAEPIHYIDSSALFMLEHLIKELHQKKIQILFSEVIGPVRDMFKKTSLLDQIGHEHFFVNTIEAYQFALHHTPKTSLQEKISLQSKGENA